MVKEKTQTGSEKRNSNKIFTFHLLGSPYNDSPQFRGWWLLVDNLVAFMAVLQRKSEDAAWAYWGMMDTDDGFYEFNRASGDKSEIKGLRHSTKLEFWANMQVGRRFEESGKKQINLVESLDAINSGLSGDLIKLYNQDGAVYVNKVGGCMPVTPSKHIVKLRECTSDKYIFPEDISLDGDKKKTKIKIFKWPNGNHFYAKVGGEDVIVDGKQKWNTAGAAESAASKFAKENGYEIET